MPLLTGRTPLVRPLPPAGPQGHKLFPLKAFFLGHVTLLGTQDSLGFSSGSQLEKWPLLFLIIEVPRTHKIKKEALDSEHVTGIQYILNIVHQRLCLVPKPFL